jgi:hypothetical protein
MFIDFLMLVAFALEDPFANNATFVVTLVFIIGVTRRGISGAAEPRGTTLVAVRWRAHRRYLSWCGGRAPLLEEMKSNGCSGDLVAGSGTPSRPLPIFSLPRCLVVLKGSLRMPRDADARSHSLRGRLARMLSGDRPSLEWRFSVDLGQSQFRDL